MREKTLQDAWTWGRGKLSEAGIEEADLDAWLLLEYATGINRASYYGNPAQGLSEEAFRSYVSYIEERSRRIPLQHITGEQEFMGYPFRVNAHVLIPRQDTECLVEEVLKELRPGEEVLDVCTGSGCILISLLKLCSGVHGAGVDISQEALQVARENAKSLNVDAKFEWSDLYEKVEGTYDVIVSNPPYIKTEEIQKLEQEVKLHDPMLALDGMEDGLFFYRRIIEEAPGYLKPGGRLYFEIGYDQGEDVSSLMSQAGFRQISVKKDLAGLDRVVCGRL